MSGRNRFVRQPSAGIVQDTVFRSRQFSRFKDDDDARLISVYRQGKEAERRLERLGRSGLRKKSRLSPKLREEIEALDAKKAAGMQAREELFMRGFCVSASYAKHEKMLSMGRKVGMGYEDLVQAGLLGIPDAIGKYDSSRGTKFSSFAYPFVRRAMHVAIAENRYIHVPHWVWPWIRASGAALGFIALHGLDAPKDALRELRTTNFSAWRMVKECKTASEAAGLEEKARLTRVMADVSTRELIEEIAEPPVQETAVMVNEVLKGGKSDVFSFLSHRAEEKKSSELPDWRRFGVPKTFFQNKEKRVEAVKWLVDYLKKDPRELESKDFTSNGLGGVLKYCGNSVWNAVHEAGYGIMPWEMKISPRGFFKKKENRIMATRWLVGKLKIDIRELRERHFTDNGIGRVLDFHGKHPYGAFVEAGYEVNPWEMGKVPKNFYKSRKNRAAAVRWMVAKEGKPACMVKSADFEKNGLGRVLQYCGKSPFRALKEAGLVKEPFEMGRVPRTYYREGKNRIASVKRLAELVGKEAREITYPDFIAHGMGSLVQRYYHGSPFEALFDAKLVTKEDESYMRSLFHRKAA